MICPGAGWSDSSCSLIEVDSRPDHRVLVERAAMGGIRAAYPGKAARRETAVQSGNHPRHRGYCQRRLSLARLSGDISPAHHDPHLVQAMVEGRHLTDDGGAPVDPESAGEQRIDSTHHLQGTSPPQPEQEAQEKARTPLRRATTKVGALAKASRGAQRQSRQRLSRRRPARLTPQAVDLTKSGA